MGMFLYDPDGNVKSPDIYLKTRNKKFIGLLNTSIPTITKSLNDYDTIEFRVYRYINDELNPYYDLIENKMLVYIQDYGHFSIEVKIINNDGYEYKEVMGNSWEVELASRYLDNFQCNTFEEGDAVDEGGNFVITTFFNSDHNRSLLHRVLKNTGWIPVLGGSSAAYTTLANKERTYDIDRQDKMSFLKELQEEFNVIFIADKENRILTCYLLEEYGEDTGIYASFQNLQKSIEVDFDDSQIVTQIKVTGGTGIYVDDVIAAPTNTLTNIDYFLTTDFMSQTTINAYNAWKNYYATKSASLILALTTLNSLHEEWLEYNNSIPQSSTKEDDGTIQELNEMTRDQLLSTFTWINYPSGTPQEERYNYGLAYLNALYNAYEEVYKVRNTDPSDDSLRHTVRLFDKSKSYSIGDYCYYPEMSTAIQSVSNIMAIWQANTSIASGSDFDSSQWIQVCAPSDEYKYDQICMVMNCVKYQISVLQNIMDEIDALIDTTESEITTIRSQSDMLQWLLDTYGDESGQAIYDEIQSFIWEDEYSNDNYIPVDVNDYTECIKVTQELLEQAEKELLKNCYPHATWTCELSNPVLREEFNYAKNKLDVGNFMWLELHEGYYAKIRIIGVEIPYDDLPNLSFTFSDRIEADTIEDEIGKHIGNATSVSASLEYYASQMDKIAETYEQTKSIIDYGLETAKINLYNNNNQEVLIDEYGIWGRQKNIAGDYNDEQIRIQSNQILFTDDSWRTIRTALGKITLYDEQGNPYTSYGLIADTVAVTDLYAIGATIGGWTITSDGLQSDNYTVTGGIVTDGIKLTSNGGILSPNLSINPSNNNVIVNAENFIVGNQPIVDYITEQAENTGYHLETGYIINETNSTVTFTASVYNNAPEDITNTFPDSVFEWYKRIDGQLIPLTNYIIGKSITVDLNEIEVGAVVVCKFYGYEEYDDNYKIKTVIYQDGTLIVNERPSDSENNILKHGSVVKTIDALTEDNPYIFTSDLTTRPWNNEILDLVTVEIGSYIQPTYMRYWFYQATNLTTVDFTKADFSTNVSWSYSFVECSNLSELKQGLPLVTSSCTSLYNTFYRCENLTSLDVGNWDVSNITTMRGTFAYCSSINGLDVSNWNTGKVESMQNLFLDCANINELAVSNWNISKVTTTNSMFRGCTGLTELNLSSWDTSLITVASHMFRSSSNLTTIIVSSLFNVSGATSSYMFLDCTSLVGGAGTVYSSANVDNTYARIDNPPDSPGYFTGNNT